MNTERPPADGRTLWRRTFARFAAHPYWGSFSGLLGLVGIALAILIPAGILFPPSHPLLHLGEPGQTGPLTMTPTTVTCGKSYKDLPREGREVVPPSVPGKQLCIVIVRIYNSSHLQNRAIGKATLSVNDKEYIDSTTEPREAALLFPGAGTKVTLYFFIPAELVPTRLKIVGFSLYEPPEEGAPILYDLRGVV